VVIPLVFFGIAGNAAVFIHNPILNQVVCTAFFFLSVFWVVGGCLQSLSKRKHMRKDILRRIKVGDNRGVSLDDSDLGETDVQITCAHAMCGVCALAQEGRQVDFLIPPEKRRLDYVTLQPFMEYFNEIRTLRKEENAHLWSHFTALSKLSRILVKALIAVIAFLVLVAAVLSPTKFQWGNMMVFIVSTSVFLPIVVKMIDDR